MIRACRPIGSELYDAIKHLPPLIRLLSLEKSERVYKALRPGVMPGVATRSYGIRIDNPGEEKFRAPWHQDYTTHLRSMDGLVFLSSLVPITPEAGPVCFCRGSHRDGLRRVRYGDPKNPDKRQSYGLLLDKEEDIVRSYPQDLPLAGPGDAVLIDYLTIHSSSPNRSNRPRWSIQLRLFNYLDEGAIRNRWHGVFPEGEYLPVVDTLKKRHPDLLVE
jgi:hypothetical protein